MLFLEKVRQAFGNIPVSLVLDNARYQHCQAVMDKAKELNIDLVFLPPYSPNLNIIERLWKYARKHVLAGKYFFGKDEFHEALRYFFEDDFHNHKSRHVLCAKHSSPLTHYTNKTKHIDYYKCNCKGCSTNIAVKRLRAMYVELLGILSIPIEYSDIIRNVILDIINAGNSEHKESLTLLKKQKAETENKLKKSEIAVGLGRE